MIVANMHIVSPCPPRSMRASLASYRKHYVGEVIYDLTQDSIRGRGRTDLRHGHMPTLATSSTFLWNLGNH